MNPLLQVKLRFNHEHNSQQPGPRNLRIKAETTLEKIASLINNLRAVLLFYRSEPRIIKNILIDVNYNDIIAKSNRIRELLKPVGKSPNDAIVGARFSDAPEGQENHIITYYVEQKTIQTTIEELEVVYRFISEQLNGKATAENFNKPNDRIDYTGYNGFSESKLRNIVVDCSVIDSFSVPHMTAEPDQDSVLITLYKTEVPISTLFEKLKIDDIHYRYSLYGDDTISATRDLYEQLHDKVPYLISMISSDFSKIAIDNVNNEKKLKALDIPAPLNEPTIGVIDTFFDENVYFSEWVENSDYIEEYEKPSARTAQREHGTQVTSLIVDGPRLNPWLDDGCGRFRVRHFGVCEERISTARLVRRIRDIVSQNPDIHVWNLSLGTDEEVSRNFISYDAAKLDELQANKNIIFVISGTNDNRDEKIGTLRVGSPADSLNSIVVNSVRRDGTPASYTRRGTVLSFYNKPDVSYYGGDYDERIIAYSPQIGEEAVYGTSFAAPWISRKMCYLIDVIGVSKEVAKALIIDSAAGWEYKVAAYKNKDLIGYGVVPIDITKILASESEEIRFLLYGTSETYKTTNYGIPIPKDENNKFPYISRATLCYFPECSRSQGVDYTNRELSLRFGRINSKGKIDDINENIQDEDGAHIDERDSRKEFRKWENTKFISKILRNNQPIKSYEERQWGITITSKERLSTKTKKGLNFGIVITLKEINGINRIQDFIRACTLRGWIVNELDIQNQVQIFNTNQEEIEFE